MTREVSSSVFHVEYDDGEAHDENLAQDTFKWHGPRASKAAEPYHPGMRPAMLELGAVNARAEEIEVSSTLSSHNVRLHGHADNFSTLCVQVSVKCCIPFNAVTCTEYALWH